jgi:hypothetical protein
MQARSNSQRFQRRPRGAFGQYLSFPVAYFNSNRPDAEQSRRSGQFKSALGRPPPSLAGLTRGSIIFA